MTIIVFLAILPVLVAILLGLSVLLAPHRPDAEKLSVYECGIPAVDGQARNPFTISYYLVGILFLLFDLEIALVYPVAVSLGTVGLYGYWIVLGFLLLLTVGFAYEWKKGAISFTGRSTTQQ